MTKLYKIELETITPIMAGKNSFFDKITDNKYLDKGITKKKYIQAELGANTFKGMLRWWFRTLHGWSEQLDKHEAALFGSTEGASPVKMRLSGNLNIEKWPTNISCRNFGPFQFSGGEAPYNGLKYFSFTNWMVDTNEGVIQIREYIKPGQKFDLILLGKQMTCFKQIILLWYSLQFAGLGNRSRRCFGNLNICIPIAIEYKSKTFHFRNQYESIEHYTKTIKDNLQITELLFPEAFKGSNEITAFTKESHLFLSQPIGNSWIEAVNIAGATMQLYRAMAKLEHDALINTSKTDEEYVLAKPIFGLPIQFRFSSSKNKIQLNHVGDENKATRFASPIFVSLVKIAGKFHVQYLLLDRNLGNLNIQAIHKNYSVPVKVSQEARNDFINFLRKDIVFPESETFQYDEINLWS
ncbi:MAG TPA: type III-B CRISPR module RAMP protein Cmr1 [bacterium]|nr:type III-B CRISPR module RAMP protein Cmr1 [bacterium]HPG46049.1 type III-B CRISPR module RAMP protein Cmr1 [bacterium]HPM97871.1 type III-B CRISPR module RAMP protein Cmr1 [bacterium]